MAGTSPAMTRREFITLLGGAAAAWPLAAHAQQPAMPAIGVLGSASADVYRERLTLIRQGLAEAGFSEGRNLAIEYRWAEARLDRLPALAAELVGRRVSVIVATGGLQAPRAAMAATSTIPIVFSTDGDPVQQGLVASFNRPGGNATGITAFTAALTAKRLDILRTLVPKANVFAVLVNPTAMQASEQMKEAQDSVRSLGFDLRVLHARSEADFDPALATLGGVQNVALLVSADPLFNARRQILIASANRYAIPAIYSRREFAADGGLISYGGSGSAPYRLMGTYVGRILKGEKPADLPVAQPTKFELVINLKTATELRLDVPDKLLALADEVIE
jgi:putative tryptophan/tyrosine transport system substrate-binding protein